MWIIMADVPSGRGDRASPPQIIAARHRHHETTQLYVDDDRVLIFQFTFSSFRISPAVRARVRADRCPASAIRVSSDVFAAESRNNKVCFSFCRLGFFLPCEKYERMLVYTYFVTLE